jgi:uncharacterized damage-inducible protein DinB
MQLKNIPTEEYANYFGLYVGKNNSEHTIDEALVASKDALVKRYLSLNDEQLHNGYAPGKWSLKQVLQHLIDTERVFTYRALTFARADSTKLPGYEQDDYVANSQGNDRSLDDLLTEYQAVRMTTRMLFKSFSEQALALSGTASTNSLSVRAIAFVIAGHDQHHLEIIRDRY